MYTQKDIPDFIGKKLYNKRNRKAFRITAEKDRYGRIKCLVGDELRTGYYSSASLIGFLNQNTIRIESPKLFKIW